MQSLIQRAWARLREQGMRAFVASAWRFLLDIPRRRRYATMLKLSTPEDRFAAIYGNNLWNSGESKSGYGSEMAATEALRDVLPRLVDAYNIQSVLDAGCGDFNWMRAVIPALPFSYTGMDIVPSVTDENSRHYGSETVTFLAGNICEVPLPAADLVIARDCLFHLSYADIDRFLLNLAQTDYRFLLTTNHLPFPGEEIVNRDIETGDFRLLDLYSAPFGIPRDAAVERLADHQLDQPREMLLLEKNVVPTRLG